MYFFSFFFGSFCYDQHIDFVLYGQAAGYFAAEVIARTGISHLFADSSPETYATSLKEVITVLGPRGYELYF